MRSGEARPKSPHYCIRYIKWLGQAPTGSAPSADASCICTACYGSLLLQLSQPTAVSPAEGEAEPRTHYGLTIPNARVGCSHLAK